MTAPRAPGFTLVEVLVVVAIIAIAAGVAAVAWRDDPRATAEREARRFAGALEYAAARAQWRNETLGVSADGRAWRFWRRADDGARWLAVADDDVLSPRSIAADHTLVPLAYAGQALPPDALIPLRPSGRNEPFAFALDSAGIRLVVASDPLNHVSVVAAGP